MVNCEQSFRLGWKLDACRGSVRVANVNDAHCHKTHSGYCRIFFHHLMAASFKFSDSKLCSLYSVACKKTACSVVDSGSSE